jgi:hypothetical protein
MTRTLRRLLAVLPAFALVLALGACSDDSTDTSTSDGSTEAEETSGELEVSDVWARTSAEGQETGAAYLVVTGGAEDDTLVGASVSADVAGTVELHETVPVDDAEGSDDSMGSSTGGMAEGMTMQPVPDIDVPAGEQVALEPGGLHVMLLELAAPLEVGDTFELTLTLEQAGEVTVPVEVRER